ncbi:hypothetical protein CF319_g7064 [Tilletia indica]|uniref:Uncharacterized protein n=1 Tax=Tilletia indica TaxID=43049 RepID=A0A177T7L8_9BASI|nr:hypothetical protein CF319_g7064 [Tilletia indica]KAE8233904.1 hypothetical protein CF326_g1060 [Tilletia indica]KAE8254306.1 hypothetical protein A4X13_0g3466 [Tilletia indica]
MFSARIIAFFALVAAISAVSTTAKSETHIKHHFRADRKNKSVHQDIVGHVKKLGPVNGNATLVWSDNNIASSSILQQGDRPQRTAYSFGILNKDDMTVETNTTSNGAWAKTDVQFHDDGHGKVFINSANPIECTSGPAEGQDKRTATVCSF